MTAIWAILYDLKHDREADYLTWFHDVHIPEKLARSGYTWAAHYELVRDDDALAAADGNKGYIAFFGGTDTSVFYNPSPAQLGPKQPQETKDMMGCRVRSTAFILAQEWQAGADGGIGADPPAVRAPAISLELYDVDGNDMDFSAWLVQSALPGCAAQGAFQGLHKLSASTGSVRHAVISCFADADAARGVASVATGDSAWKERVGAYTLSPLEAQTGCAVRRWPT